MSSTPLDLRPASAPCALGATCRSFDGDCRDQVMDNLAKRGIKLHAFSQPTS